MNQDEDIYKWIEYYRINTENLNSINEFVLLINAGNFFINHSFSVGFDDENYDLLNPCGFVEVDFKRILYEQDDSGVSKIRLALILTHGIKIENLLKYYKFKKYKKVLTETFIKGDYDKFGIDDVKFIKNLIDNYSFPKKDFVDACFFRGVYLSERES